MSPALQGRDIPPGGGLAVPMADRDDVVRAACHCGWTTTRPPGTFGADRDAFAQSALLAHQLTHNAA